MRRCLAILSGVFLAAGALSAGQSTQPKPVAKKSSASTAAKPAEKMDGRAAVSGFVTHVAKGDDGDTDIRICENPKIDGMDRARCIVARCIPKLPCDGPRVGKPITVKGITQYVAKVGTHWWEIHPVEEIEK